MEFSTTDWVALFIFGVSALVGTFGKRLVRIIGLAVMPTIMRVSRYKDQLPTMRRVSTLTTRTTKVAALMFLTSSDRRGCFSMQRLGINWRASYRSGNLLRFWLLELDPIGISRTSMPNI